MPPSTEDQWQPHGFCIRGAPWIWPGTQWKAKMRCSARAARPPAELGGRRCGARPAGKRGDPAGPSLAHGCADFLGPSLPFMQPFSRSVWRMPSLFSTHVLRVDCALIYMVGARPCNAVEFAEVSCCCSFYSFGGVSRWTSLIAHII